MAAQGAEHLGLIMGNVKAAASGARDAASAMRASVDLLESRIATVERESKGFVESVRRM